MPFDALSHLTTLANSNIIAVTSCGSAEVQIWDRVKASMYYTITVQRRIANIRLRPDVLIVVCETLTLIYNLASNQQMATINTAPNPSGAVAIDSSYSSLVIAVPSIEVGGVEVYDCLDPSTPIRSFRAFRRPINAIEFSRDRAIVAVASHSSRSVLLYATDSGSVLRTLRLHKRDRVYRIAFDESAMHVAIQLETKTVYIFQLPIFDAAAPERPAEVKSDAQYSVAGTFWSFFAGKLFEMNVVTDQMMLSRVRYDALTKAFTELKTVDLRTLEREP
jgi:WD40 repeat protein